MRRWRKYTPIVAAITGALVVAAGYDYVAPSGGGTPSSTAANLWVDTNGGTCSRFSTPSAYSDGQACGSFNAAYQAAACGDTVNVVSGSYSSQTITDQVSKRNCSSHVVFQPTTAYGATVTGIDFGQNQVTDSGSDWIEVRDMTLTLGLGAWFGASNLKWTNLNGGSFYIQGANNMLLSGNDWGPCASNTGGGCQGQQNFIDANYGSPNGTYDITIDGDTFHDYTITPNSGAHFECLYVTGANGAVTIKNSWFYNCETYNIYFTGWASNHGYTNANFTVENNWFGRTCCFGASDRNSAINIGGLNPNNILLRFNSFAPGQTLVSEGGTPGNNFRAVGNIFGTGSCVSGVQYSYNVFFDTPTCGSTWRQTTSSIYTNAGISDTANYHLTGSAGAADNYVADSSDSSLATDRDGDTRVAPRDAGADER